MHRNKRIAFNRKNNIRLFISKPIIVIISLIITGWFYIVVKWLRGSFHRTQAPTPAPTTPSGYVQFKIHTSGEDLPYEVGRKADLRLVSGGANLEPERTFWFPELLAAWSNIFLDNRDRGLQIKDRHYADVFYRSSFCSKDREDLVGLVRRHVEAAGFTFVIGGLCGGTGYPLNDDWSEERGWTKCVECMETKLMIAFERFHEGQTYLGEKLFVPLEYGAIPLYYGNGHPWMDLLTVNRKSFLDRRDFKSDEAFAIATVELLRNPSKLQQMQNEEVFIDLESARNRVDFWKDPLKVGMRGFPELEGFLQKSAKYQQLKNKQMITYATSRLYHVTLDRFIRFIFPNSNVQRIDNVADADIELYRCC